MKLIGHVILGLVTSALKLKKEDVGNSGSIGNDLSDWPSPSWLLAVDNIPNSRFCCYSTLIWYDFKAYFSDSQAVFLFLFLVNLDPLP